MKNKYLLYVLFISVTLINCNQRAKEAVDNKFAGLWSLHIMEQRDPESTQWREWRNGMQGYILYDDKNNMSVHLTTKGYEKTHLDFPNFVDTIPIEALRHLTNSYVYFAKYSVDEEKGIVEHARISHSNPAEWNDIVRRRYTFSGDTLILQPVEERNAGLRLKWVRERK